MQLSRENPHIPRKYIVRARVKPRKSYARKIAGFQATGDTETQLNREKIKEKNTQYPKKEISPVESLILL
jgi:hypothetical protein